jgi:hypothetical protein
MASYAVKNPPKIVMLLVDTVHNCFRKGIAQCFGGYRKEREIHPTQYDF